MFGIPGESCRFDTPQFAVGNAETIYILGGPGANKPAFRPQTAPFGSKRAQPQRIPGPLQYVYGNAHIPSNCFVKERPADHVRRACPWRGARSCPTSRSLTVSLQRPSVTMKTRSQGSCVCGVYVYMGSVNVWGVYMYRGGVYVMYGGCLCMGGVHGGGFAQGGGLWVKYQVRSNFWSLRLLRGFVRNGSSSLFVPLRSY